VTAITTRNQRRALKTQSARWPIRLIEIPPSDWPPQYNPHRKRVWRSRDYLVQEFTAEPPAIARLSINRAAVVGNAWADNITWEELMEIKTKCGYADRDAVEIYPPVADVVHVANLRHLWILDEKLPFAWRSNP
jgi:hypothetical protein